MECTSSTTVETKVTSEDIILHLMNNKEVYFKSQQIGEEDLSTSEKENIARSILESNKSNFLSRFGKYLKLEHMDYFKQFLKENSEDYLFNYHYNSLLRYHTKSAHTIDIRNRRYEALKHLIAEDSYFSEKEMMKRNPLLYDQLVGRYLTQEEIKRRDNVDTKNITFVNLLMEGIEKNLLEDKKKKQIVEENVMDDDSNSGDNFHKSLAAKSKNGPFSKIQWNKYADKRKNDENEEEEEEDSDEEDPHPICEAMQAIEEPEETQCKENIAMDTEPCGTEDCGTKKFIAFRISPKKLEKSKKPLPVLNGHVSHREEMRSKVNKAKKNQKLVEQCKKWGEYESIEEIRPWKRTETKIKCEDQIISSQERNMMREEFLSLMYQSFLDGKDDFDYSTVDFNEEYDNTDILEQDAEEKYFESESPNEDDIDDKKSMVCSSDDELDVFMNRLNQHPTICQLSHDMKKL